MIKQLDIPFVALKQGIHNFSFEVENAFFEAFPYSIIDEGFISVELSLDKKDTLMVGDYKIFGSVVSTCATCNDVVEVEHMIRRRTPWRVCRECAFQAWRLGSMQRHLSPMV